MKYISQCIIANKGNVALKRKKLCYSKQEDGTFNTESNGPVNASNISALLNFSSGTIDVGCSLGYEIFNPLNIFNAGTQQVKIEVCCYIAMKILLMGSATNTFDKHLLNKLNAILLWPAHQSASRMYMLQTVPLSLVRTMIRNCIFAA